jgi:hypothetical protein
MKATPNERPYPRQQFGQDKGFGEIVVSPGIQPLYSLLNQTPSREHHDRSLYPSLAQLAAYFDPADPRQPDVEENGVISNICAGFKSLLAGLNHIHCIRVFAQGTCDKAGDLSLVFD